MKYWLKTDHAKVCEEMYGDWQNKWWDPHDLWEPVPDDPPAAGAFDIKAAKEVMSCITALLLQHDSSAADLRIVERYQGLLAQMMPAVIAEIERLGCKLTFARDEEKKLVAEIERLTRKLHLRRKNVLLGLRGIGESGDTPEPEFTLGVLAAGLKAEVERLKKENTELREQLLQIAAMAAREIPPGWVIGKGETP